VVAAMVAPSAQSWLNKMYDAIKHKKENYYEDCVNMLCLLTLSGNFWDPTTIGTGTGLSHHRKYDVKVLPQQRCDRLCRIGAQGDRDRSRERGRADPDVRCPSELVFVIDAQR
jgi:hypothetical protein